MSKYGDRKEEKKFYEELWFAVIMIVFLLPLGLILMWKYEHFNQVIRIIVTVITILWTGLVFTLILLGFLFTVVGDVEIEDENERGKEIVQEEKEKKKKEKERKKEEEKKEKERKKKRDKYIKEEKKRLKSEKIKINIGKREMTEDNVYVEGTTNIVDGAVLVYSIEGYEGTTKVEDGKWNVEASREDVDSVWTVIDAPEEKFFWISFSLLTPEYDGNIELDDGSYEEQEDIMYEIYGESGKNIDGKQDNVETIGDKKYRLKRIVAEEKITEVKN